VAGVGAALVSAGITVAVLAGNPSPSTTPAQTAAPQVKACEIVIEGDATNVVLGAEGDHFVIPRVDGSYTYTITWSPAKKC
jgi:hypothetical protein